MSARLTTRAPQTERRSRSGSRTRTAANMTHRVGHKGQSDPGAAYTGPAAALTTQTCCAHRVRRRGIASQTVAQVWNEH